VSKFELLYLEIIYTWIWWILVLVAVCLQYQSTQKEVSMVEKNRYRYLKDFFNLFFTSPFRFSPSSLSMRIRVVSKWVETSLLHLMNISVNFYFVRGILILAKLSGGVLRDLHPTLPFSYYLPFHSVFL